MEKMRVKERFVNSQHDVLREEYQKVGENHFPERAVPETSATPAIPGRRMATYSAQGACNRCNRCRGSHPALQFFGVFEVLSLFFGCERA